MGTTSILDFSGDLNTDLVGFQMVWVFSDFFLPSSGISHCGWTDVAVMPPTLGAALLCSSRPGSDMWLLSINSTVYRDWGRTIGVCVAS